MSVCLLFVQKIAKSPQQIVSFLFLFLVLLFLPTQLGYHFWPEFAYIKGLRIDYLSPVVYVTDICILAIFTLNARAFIASLKLWMFLLGLFLVTGIFLSLSSFVGWYGLLKLIEFIFLGWFISRHTKQCVRFMQVTLPIGIFVESGLAIWQFILQHSVGGLWYFLGERTFSGSTPGISNASLNGTLVLRPYATFPHPNVLAGYLLMCLIFVVLFLKQQNRVGKVAYVLAALLGCFALFLTMSRSAIIVGVLFLIAFLMQRAVKKSIGKKFQIIAACAVVIFLTSLALQPRFSGINITGESVVLREQLLLAAWKISIMHPVFGVGLNNFLVALPIVSLSLPIQPVHNIFMLILAETGVIGLGVFVFLLYKTFKHVFKATFEHLLMENTRIFVLCSLIIFFSIGLFDHYFLTLQQGQLLTVLIFGLAWTGWKN